MRGELEKSRRELADMNAAGTPDPADVATLAARYELPFEQPDWIEDVIARYSLTSPF